MRSYLSARCIRLHILLLVLLPAFAWLTRWQLSRAEGGNTLSWAYVFLWPCFGIYALYTWWQLVHDQAAPRPGRHRSPAAHSSTSGPGGTEQDEDPEALPPGWALTGGRARNVAIAASAPIDAERGGRGERYTASTPDETARLEQYNRYLAELSGKDGGTGSSS